MSIKGGENSAAVRAATADLQQQADAAMLPPDTAAQLDTALGQLAGLGTNPASPDPAADTTGYHDVRAASASTTPPA
ncbi:MAG TPA: hypothetical protein VHZ97_14695 [Pseudonocardiaceae bacterium]|nr:hypothetical protein [Pseudonocardiaceae bacterium]